MILKYAALWIVSFIGISLVDALWHLVLWKKAYVRGIQKVAAVVDGKLVLNNLSGALSQVLVVTAMVVLASLQFASGKPAQNAVIACMMGGILGISVYGLVNHWLIKDWNITITLLEVVWGPVIGALAGLIIVWTARLLKIL